MLFYLIFQLLPFSIKSGEIHQHINDVYSKLGITKEQLVQLAKEEKDVITEELFNSKIDKIACLSAAGCDNYDKIDWDVPKLPVYELNLPAVVLGDDTKHVLLSYEDDNLLKDYNIESLYEELIEGQFWVERFSEACE
ncbi:TPA: hypothetical protein ACPVXZ_000732 [Vibrio parahaemolyticus]